MASTQPEKNKFNSWLEDYIVNSPQIYLAKDEEDAQKQELEKKANKLGEIIVLAKHMYQQLELIQRACLDMRRTTPKYTDEEAWMEWQNQFADFPIDTKELSHEMVFEAERQIQSYKPKVVVHDGDRVWMDMDRTTSELAEHLAVLITKASIWLEDQDKHFKIWESFEDETPF